MKEKILKSIDNFVNICYTMFKIGVGNFAKENFPKIVENVWNDSKTDGENYENVKKMFEGNITINNTMGNKQPAKTIEIFLEDWYNKISLHETIQDPE